MNTRALGWDALFFQGSIIDLDIEVWSARLSVRPSDLGIEDTKDVREALTLGTVRLAPKKAFDRILQVRRAALKDVENASFNFPFIRGARYVPEVKVASLIEKLKERDQDYNYAVYKFAEEYNEIRVEMLTVIRQALLDAKYKDIDASMARVNAEYPEDIVTHFGFAWKVYAISGAKSKAAAEGADEEAQAVKGIIREIIVQLRTEFSEKVEGIAKIIGRGGKVPTTSVASCRELLKRVREMNVFGDEELNRQVIAFERILALADAGEAGYANTSPNDLNSDLDKIQETMKQSLDDAVAAAEANLTGLGRRRLEV